jgi:eukaryotic-like serine/threonine-protein kinase
MMLERIIEGARSRFSRPVPHKTLGPYALGRKLGEGGMGSVYEASHTLLRRRTAIKTLPAARAGSRAIARFEREVQVTARLSHPNIVPVYDFGRSSDGTFYYAMEYLDGVDLQRLVDDSGPLPASRVAHVLCQAAEALAEAHAAGVIHRDIKPGNLILCDHARRPDLLKVVDFGLVRELDGDDAAAADPDLLAGTPLYMAPEAITAPADVDGRSDLYALGAVGYFLLTGRPPFTGRTVVEVLSQHLHATVVPPSERTHAPIPTDLENVILSCLAKSPADRPASASAVVDALRACQGMPSWAYAEARAWWSQRAAA